MCVKYIDELDELERNVFKEHNDGISIKKKNIVCYIGFTIYGLCFLYKAWFFLFVIFPLLLFIYLMFIIK